MAIETVDFDLSMTDVDTGAYLVGHTYSLTVTDADGVTQTTLTNLSIAQLVMAVCLERAVAKEKEIIDTMNSLNKTSSELQATQPCSQAGLKDFWPPERALSGQVGSEAWGQVQEGLPWVLLGSVMINVYQPAL